MLFSYTQVILGHLQVTLALEPLATRRQLQDVSFLRRLSLERCPTLLHLFDHGPTRSSDLLCRPSCSTNYELHSTIPRLLRISYFLLFSSRVCYTILLLLMFSVKILYCRYLYTYISFLIIAYSYHIMMLQSDYVLLDSCF